MKKLIFAIAVVATCIACAKAQLPEEELVNVTFSFSSFTMEPMTKGSVDVTSVATRIDLLIKDGNTTVATINLSSPSYTAEEITLNKTKTYTVYAFAHSYESAVTIANDGSVSLPNTNVTDTFYGVASFNPTQTLECELVRITARFSIWITDAIPEGVDRFVLSASSGATGFNIPNHTVPGTAAVTKSFTSWTSAESGTMFSMYIVPNSVTDAATSNFTVTAYSGNDVVVSETFTNVQIRSNYKTMYKGEFFTANTLSFSLTTDTWNNYDIVEF